MAHIHSIKVGAVPTSVTIRGRAMEAVHSHKVVDLVQFQNPGLSAMCRTEVTSYHKREVAGSSPAHATHGVIVQMEER